MPARLDWILRQIGYTWTHAVPVSMYRLGTVVETFDAPTERVADGYNWLTTSHRCEVLRDLGTALLSTTSRSAAI